MNGGPGALSNQCDRWPLPPRPLQFGSARFSP